MNPDPSAVNIIFSTKSADLTTPSHVTVNLSSEFNMKELPKEEAAELEQLWENRKTENPKLYNGTKFRLASLSEKGDVLNLDVGVTCYKHFQGTNLSEKALELQSRGLRDHGDSQAYMSDAIGIGAMVLTSDNHVVLLFRSSQCGEDKNLWDRPGGHPEPMEIVGKIPMEEIPLTSMSSSSVVHETFDAILREVTEEVNIPRSALDEPRILGISRNMLNSGKPNIEFLIHCSLTADEVKQLYAKGDQIDAYESEHIKLLPLQDALSAHRDDIDLWNNMAPGVKGLITLYNMYKHRFLS